MTISTYGLRNKSNEIIRCMGNDRLQNCHKEIYLQRVNRHLSHNPHSKNHEDRRHRTIFQCL